MTLRPPWQALLMLAAGIGCFWIASARAAEPESTPTGHRVWQLWYCPPNEACRVRGRPLGKHACILDLTDAAMKLGDAPRWACVSIERVPVNSRREQNR